MTKAGRPRKNGLQPMWMLERVTLVLFAYERAREAGEKHCVAVSEAVKHIREVAPHMRISETEVKRILAMWRSKRRTTCVSVKEPDPKHSVTPVPGRDGRIIYARIAYTAWVGPHPIYPRANAAEKPRESSPPGH